MNLIEYGGNMRDLLKKIFKGYKPGINAGDGRRYYSVIIPIIEIGGEYNIVFEVRNDNLKDNPGEICFPGGSIEEGESPKEAAMRECYEEIGTKPSDIEIISELDLFVPNNNMVLYPFLGYIKDGTSFVINKDEVKELLIVPLNYLLTTEAKSVVNKIITIPSDDFPYEYIKGGKNYKFREGSYRVVFYKYNDYVIWGMTAKILENFLEIIKSSI
ncbi:NUDIX hydrolase [Clostridium sardiniense]|uniref:NUDIX hydrolase n=1 Tax=Clostridium sardiniense TaxID=29369 RepID=UPI0019585382|nr:CoA pyrophosphatase [Clostridium sardiniense]